MIDIESIHIKSSRFHLRIIVIGKRIKSMFLHRKIY